MTTTTLGAITPGEEPKRVTITEQATKSGRSLRAAGRLYEENRRLLQERDELVGALEWLTHIGYGVGKRGGHPESGEIEQALTEAKALLSKYPKP